METNTKSSQPVLLEVKNLKKYFQINTFNEGKQTVHALNGISFLLRESETLGLVGESGCGKSTAARAILRLVEPTSGEILYRNHDLIALKQNKLRPLRKEMQIIFQDPFASLNPRKRVRKILEEPLDIHGLTKSKEKKERVAWLLDRVGLSLDQAEKYPHEFSGGQLQRIGIARAIALNPSLIIADEPVSALDVSIRAQIINLLLDLKESMRISYLFISHDMNIVRHFCDRVAVMYLGRIVEIADSDSLYKTPRHPYTEALLSAIPSIDPEAKKQGLTIKGDLPSTMDMPQGCAFYSRCPIGEKRCEQSVPQLKEINSGHQVACFLRG
ncbi:MAG TPA: dipeptide ABC transporter ATP-binding protein [Nitrospinaceae bacterium]|nr:dipeptide ABC transporter ATP-binding protein [Nitrospinaceae bacterium]